MDINFKKLNDLAITPTRGSEYAAGYDLYAATSYTIEVEPHSTVKVGTGLAVELPENTFAAIFPRSGIASKRGLAPANKVGVCDADYRGEYMIMLHNHTNSVQTIEPGERIAQMILMPYIPMEFNEVDELSETVRGTGGFGSTGQ